MKKIDIYIAKEQLFPFLTGFLFFLVAILGIIIRKTINKKILTTLDCGVIKVKDNRKYLNFLILI